MPGDGPRSFLPGYAMVLLGLELLPELVRERSGWTLLLVPILLAEVAFLVLPVLFLVRVLHRPRLNQVLRLTFICGGCAYVCYLWNFRSRPPEFGAYLWLVAAVTAVKCLACCPTQPATRPTGGTAATG